MGNIGEIHHSGIKGMKWGIWNEETRRKRLGSGGRNRSSNPKKEAKNRMSERKKADKYSSLLSDKELDKRIKRLEKEKRLRELTSSEINSGKKATGDFLSKYGNQIAGAIVAAVAAEVAAQMIGRSKAKRQAEEIYIKKNYGTMMEERAARADKVGSTLASASKSIITGNGLPAISSYANKVAVPKGKHAKYINRPRGKHARID